MSKIKIEIIDIDPMLVFGVGDKFLYLIEKKLHVNISARGNFITISGDDENLQKAERIFQEIILTIEHKKDVSEQDIITLIDTELGGDKLTGEITTDTVILFKKNGVVKPRTKVQSDYFKSTKKNDVVFAVGPAGTGKTYMAVAIAVASLRNHDVDRIILTRPAVETGESLGYLPGDLKEKIEPYLAPLNDALLEMILPEKYTQMCDQKVIEIVPLAYMRGRTLNNAFVILDEAQNATNMQMKMFLTRLGENSRAIITGDITQIDIPDKNNSGLIEAKKILQDIDGIDFVYFSEKDVVRHRLVKEIIKAYKKHDK